MDDEKTIEIRITKKRKIILIVLGILFIAGSIRLVVFLSNVNRDLDSYYYRIILLENQVKQLRTNQASMISSRDAQRLLDQQAAAYQGQINDLNGAINGAYYQMDQNQQKAYDAYQLRQMESGIKYRR